jgi:hypothetical protein
MTVRGNGENLRIANVETDNGPNALGPTVMRAIKAELAKAYPDATHMTGNRITGARGAIGKKEEVRVPLRPRKVDLEPSLPVRADNPPPADTRVKKLNELKERGKPEDMDAYLKTLEKLKKDDLLGVAEQYVGGKLAAKDKRSKATIIAAIKAGVPTEKAPPKGDGSLTVPIQDLAGMGVMQLRKVAKDSMLVLNQAQKKGDIIALFHKTFNADGSRKVAQAGSEVALLPPERGAEVAPAPAEREPDLLVEPRSTLIPGAPLAYEHQLRQAGWTESKERIDEIIRLSEEKLHLLRDPNEKEIAREIGYAIEDARDLLARNKFDEAKSKVAEALQAGVPMRSSASQLWMQDLRGIARAHGIDIPEGATREVQRSDIATGQATEEGKAALIQAEKVIEKQKREVVVEKKAAPKLPLKGFYDYLEGPNVVKSARWMAKQLNTTVETALKLLDHGVDNGWLKLKDDGTYIRVPKKDRPARPSGPVMPALEGDVALSRDTLNRLLARNEEEMADLLITMEQARTAFQSIGEKMDQLDSKSETYVKDIRELGRQGKELQKGLERLEDRLGVLQRRRDNWEGQIQESQHSEADRPPSMAGKTDLEYLRAVEEHAMTHIGKTLGFAEGPVGVHQRYGYTSWNDYVFLAQSHGYKTPADYWSIMDAINKQVDLVARKVMTEATRILPEPVRVQVMDQSRVGTGEYAGTFRGITFRDGLDRIFVQVAKTWDEKRALDTINHESVHALRMLGLFTQREWDVLTRTGVEEEWMSPDLQKRYLDFYASEEARIGYKLPKMNYILEEAVAQQYGKWAARGQKSTQDPVAIGLFERIKAFLENLMKQAVRYFKGPTAEEIFQAIHRGDIAKRWREWGGDSLHPETAKNSVRQAALNDMVKDMNARMRELAFDDSEKKGNIAVRSLEALMPCAAYNL